MSDSIEFEEAVVVESLPEGTEVVENKELTDDQAQALLLELQTGERKFKHRDATYVIKYPSTKNVQEADWLYSTVFADGLNTGLPIKAELEKKLIDRGVLTSNEDHEKELDKIRKEIKRLEVKFEQAKKTEHKKELTRLAKELAKFRQMIYDSVIARTQYLNNSVESKADDARTSYLIHCTIFNEDGTRLWNTYDEYLNERDYPLVSKAGFEYIRFSSGISTNFMDEFPETAVLESLQNEQLDEEE